MAKTTSRGTKFGGVQIQPAPQTSVVTFTPSTTPGGLQPQTETQRGTVTTFTPQPRQPAIQPLTEAQQGTVVTFTPQARQRITLVDQNVQPLNPVVAMQGVRNPPVATPVFFPPTRSELSQVDFEEEALSLETYTYRNGQVISTIASVRPEILLNTNIIPAFSQTGDSQTRFGVYLDDLYQSSLVRDTYRRYLILNRANSDNNFQGTLEAVGKRLNDDITAVERTIAGMDSLIGKNKELQRALDLKSILENTNRFVRPFTDVKSFMTQRLLFSDRAYTGFSDTKVAYQLLSDLSGMLQKCSFGLIDGFTDNDRSTETNTLKKQNAQDPITLDLTYGDGLRYSPSLVRGRYVNTYSSFNTIVSSLPSATTDRIKFITNLLSRELKVSKGLGKYKLPQESEFFGFGDKGNPFDNIIGAPPSDIFLQPGGRNSLSSLFFLRTGQQNAVVLPYESRQVNGDGQTVFIPGSVYFGDGVLNGDFTILQSYRESFSERLARAQTVFNRLLLEQSKLDQTSKLLDSVDLFKSVLESYQAAQALVRKNNNDATAILSFALFLLGSDKPKVRFEVFKLLLLVLLYDTRPSVTVDATNTDKFRDLLFSELSQEPLQGFSEPLNESGIPKAIEVQMEAVKSLLVANTKTLTDSFQGKTNVAQIQLQQFESLAFSLRTTPNLFKGVSDVVKAVFSACSGNKVVFHLVEGSSVTRFNGITTTGLVLFVFELFCAVAQRFANKNMSFGLRDSIGGRQESSRFLEVDFNPEELATINTNISNFVAGNKTNEKTLTNASSALLQEEANIANILQFFTQLNESLGRVTAPNNLEISLFRSTNPGDVITANTARLAKGILRSVVDKRAGYNPTNNRALEFYLPNTKPISSNSWLVLKSALQSNNLFKQERAKILSVGVPKNFVNSVLGMPIKPEEAFTGKLNTNASNDLVSFHVHRLDKVDEGIIYKPLIRKFDLSLFPKGFDSYQPVSLAGKPYSDLVELFQYYDFDEDLPYSSVVAESLSDRVSGTSREAVENLFLSWLLGLYQNLATGLNPSEEVFIEYTEKETDEFSKQLLAGNLPLSRFMSPEYVPLLNSFPDGSDAQKVILGLTNDIPKTVLRGKEYDRVFFMAVNPDQFPIDIVAMRQNKDTQRILEGLYSSRRVVTDPITGEVYKIPEAFSMDSYFVSVEV